MYKNEISKDSCLLTQIRKTCENEKKCEIMMKNHRILRIKQNKYVLSINTFFIDIKLFGLKYMQSIRNKPNSSR